MERWLGKVAVVIGASAGIGAAIAANLAKSGVTVVGLARRKDRLEELEKKLQGKTGKFHAHVADMSKEQDIVSTFKWIQKNVGPIAILINNAGISKKTTLSDGDVSLWRDVIDTNVLGLSIATREAVRSMKANGIDGHIVHINSITGHRVIKVPNISMYPASKFAVTALAETLRNELVNAKSKIKVTSVSPGAVETEFMEAFHKSGKTEVSQEIKDMLSVIPRLTSEDVADAVAYVLATPPHVQIQELTIKPVGEQL